MAVYLRRGDKGTVGDGGKGDWIVSWQAFLAGEGSYEGDYSPNFGPRSEAATKDFQEEWGIGTDGIVGGDATAAAEKLGYDAPWTEEVKPPADAGDHDEGWMDPAWPSPVDLDGDGRADLVYLSSADRQKMWGPLEYTLVDGKPTITNDWKKNVVKVHVPQLKGVDVYGKPGSGNVYFHKKAAAQLLGAFQQVEDEGLSADLLTFGGTYVLRFIRGSTKTLSNHAFAVAFDLNMSQNGLGKRPSLVGEKGTLRRLAQIFERWGFFWGGWYRNRKDGMHFECVRHLPADELKAMLATLKKSDHIMEWCS